MGVKFRDAATALGLSLLVAVAAGCNGPDEVPETTRDAEGRTAISPADAGGPGAATSVSTASETSPAASSPVVTVYKTATCGCCSAWVEHMREAGFEVEAHDVPQAELSVMKAERGVAPRNQSCHTALVGDYVVEGHVPADLVRRMLEEQPPIAGLAVPGMPRGSPGMETADGTKDAYDVVAFTEDGREAVYDSR